MLYTCPYFIGNKYKHMVGAHSNVCFSMGAGGSGKHTRTEY